MESETSPHSHSSNVVFSLDDMVRRIVRDEVASTGGGVKATGDPTAHATPMDLVMFAVVAADCALVLVLYHANDNKAVDDFVKVMQWTGGTVFVAAATWFQKQFLELTRGKWSRVVAWVALVFLLPQQIPLIPIAVPRSSELVDTLKFDDDTIRRTDGYRMVTARSHTLSAVLTGGCASEQPPLVLEASHLWKAMWEPELVPVFYKVSVILPDESDFKKVLVVSRGDRRFSTTETDLVKDSLVKHAGSGHLRGATSSETHLDIDMDAAAGGSVLALATGSYMLEARRLETNYCFARISVRLDQSFTDCKVTLEPSCEQ